ncbi:MAG: hypothetical protein UT24_C0027G0003 [Candidatus Woesebacteria bacterium GW2011_GWB1_39_12]|uniref:Uncharacterized protein n=1 Tax=Candidatus Woesebacteria bacterium GW2011_GWB1_39_12 TaxID=1618574 RepID=A0A0G0QBU9_9BACT|nr:MAG: hypothetical protein UT24_C0027G0003 [Candidatus Woesebacteria bacterium GW2011_GWB1_39_12]
MKPLLPTIIRDPRRETEHDPPSFALYSHRTGQCKSNHKKFLQSFDEAKSLVGDSLDLAFRFDVQTESMSSDNLKESKFGGLPNFENFFSHEETAEQFVNRHWPRCGVCHKPMQFIGQVDLSDWLWAIHSITLQKVEDDRDFACSLLGYKLDHNWMTFWFCQETHFYAFNTHTSVVKGMDSREWDTDFRVCKFTTDDLMPELIKLDAESRSHERLLHVPQLERVVGIDLKWDLIAKSDLSEEEDEEAWDKCWELKGNVPRLFGNDSFYELFGDESTQQMSMECLSQRNFPVKQMTPVISWNCYEEDITNQIFADLCQWNDWSSLDNNAFGLINSTCT